MPRAWDGFRGCLMTRILEAARHFLKLGFRPIPLHPESKEPINTGWPNLRLEEKDLPSAFQDGCNLGLLLGLQGEGLVDIDLDSPEATAIAEFFLPQTTWRHGRESNPV